MTSLWAGLLFSVIAWNEPEIGDKLALTQDIDLVSAKFPAGKALRLREVEPVAVPGAPLFLYTLTEEVCETPEAQTDLEIVTPNGNPESTAAGVQVSPGCVWEIYLEQKDFYTPSFFTYAP